MKKKILIMLLICFTVAGYVSAADRPLNLGKAMIPLASASVSIAETGGSRVITISSLEIYKNQIEIYGGDGIEYCTLQSNSCTYPAGRWLNFMFKGLDGNYHYVLVTDEYRVVRQPWMGTGVSVMPNFGKGAAIIYNGDLQREYR